MPEEYREQDRARMGGREAELFRAGGGPHLFIEPGNAIETDSDGSVHISVIVHDAAKVEVAIGNNMHKAQRFEMGAGEEEDLYEYRVPPDSFFGPQCVRFFADGKQFFNPSAPMWHYANSICNYYEFPDPEIDHLTRYRDEIPHGKVSFERFRSSSLNRVVNTVVYTPPGFSEKGEYPVLYLFHEIGENRVGWTGASRLSLVMDELIYSGQSRPFVIFENDCTMKVDYKQRDDWYEGFDLLEKMVLEDSFETLEKKYRICPDRKAHAICGFGLGGIQAMYIGARHTDRFSHIGTFTAFWPTVRQELEHDPFREAFCEIAANPGKTDLIFHAEGSMDGHFFGIEAETNALKACGITELPQYRFFTYKQDHNWGLYRRAMADYAPLLFKNK